LRPDPATWLGTPGAAVGQDELVLHDSYRVLEVDLGGRPTPLAADFDAAYAMAEEAANGRRMTLVGFLNPTVELSNAGIRILEPYQPGKTIVVFAHGLLDNPFIFADAFANLASRTGFLDRFQLAVFRYPTGNSFLRSAAIYRRQLFELAQTLDPSGADRATRNMILAGYSMGGLLSKLQITSSGDAVWATVARRPLDSIVTLQSTTDSLRDGFSFAPTLSVGGVVSTAPPHEGSALPPRLIGRLGSRLAGRPAEAEAILAQIVRDNPGAVAPELLRSLPSSIDLLAR